MKKQLTILSEEQKLELVEFCNRNKILADKIKKFQERLDKLRK